MQIIAAIEAGLIGQAGKRLAFNGSAKARTWFFDSFAAVYGGTVPESQNDALQAQSQLQKGHWDLESQRWESTNHHSYAIDTDNYLTG